MRGGGRIVGLAMMAISVVLFVGWTAAVVASGSTSGGLVLGLFLALVVCAPLLGIGFYLWRKGQQEESEFAQVAQEKKILNMVLTQGQVSVQEIIVELQQPRETVEDMIRNLVGKQLFSGAINWEKGLLLQCRQPEVDGRPELSQLRRRSRTGRQGTDPMRLVRQRGLSDPTGCNAVEQRCVMNRERFNPIT